jgi:hypothetical protein
MRIDIETEALGERVVTIDGVDVARLIPYDVETAYSDADILAIALHLSDIGVYFNGVSLMDMNSLSFDNAVNPESGE